jgi:hypothetical protein
VRVDEPQTVESLQALSTWRIYYLNVSSGLPDRVEYQLNGQQITADFLAWTEAQGERTPSHIRWSSGGQTIMEYQVSNLSHNSVPQTSLSFSPGFSPVPKQVQQETVSTVFGVSRDTIGAIS